MIDISKELKYLIEKGYEPEQAFRFITRGDSYEQSTESSCSANLPTNDTESNARVQRHSTNLFKLR